MLENSAVRRSLTFINRGGGEHDRNMPLLAKCLLNGIGEKPFNHL